MTTLIPIEKLTITENRQRTTFDAQAMDDLRSSIETQGLLQAPVCREQDGKIILVAGERRIRSIKDLWALGGTLYYESAPIKEGFVPVTNLGNVTILEAEEAELEENLRRENLTWQEQADAESRLFRLRQKQADQKVAEWEAQAASEDAAIEGIPARPVQPTVASIAQESRGKSDQYNTEGVRNSLTLARHLDDPEIAKAKSAREAMKILNRREELNNNARLAIEVGKTFSSSSHTILNVDCLEEMAKPEYAARYDIILTDPPYGMGADSFGNSNDRNLAQHQYDDSYESWKILMAKWAPLTALVAKPEAHLYAFCDFDRFHELKAMLEAAGWKVFRTPFVYQKINSGRVPLPEHGPRRTYELVLYAFRGDKKVNSIQPDIFAAEADANAVHGASKPIASFANLLARSAKPGDEVLDCFAGSGPAFNACHSAKTYATLMEVNQAYYGIILKRIEALERQGSGDLLSGLMTS